jgi:D-xylose transport system permease protein
VREPGAQVVAAAVEKNLRLVFEPAEGLGVNDPVAVALVLGAPERRLFLELPPLRIVLALGAAGLLCHFIAVKTRAGRYAFALGSNAEAARYAGIPVRGITIFVFALMGLMAWLAGLTATSQLMAGAADIGDQQELYAIAACVLGRTSLRGGTGNVWMSILGALLMASILNGMEQMGIASTVQKIILGVILVAAVAADQWTRRQERHS